MIVVITYDKEGRQICEDHWNLGDSTYREPQGLNGTTLHVIATNRELEWIRANITGIRMNRSNHIRWIGEDATFIANSLPKREELEGKWQC
jgi:hypothetical protein